jgi:hypothetical protein
MSVYTCFDMVADCKAGKSEGWIHLVRTFVPALRWFASHYNLDEDTVPRSLLAIRDEIHNWEPMTDREIAAKLRPELPLVHSRLDLAVLAGAFEPFTLVERQLVWLETMGYDAVKAARLMRMSEQTATKIRERASDFLRAKLDDWSQTLLRDNGVSLGSQARAAMPDEAVPFHHYIEMIDGRLTWQVRSDVERKLEASWHEIDHFCRIREADAAMRESTPLTRAEADGYLDVFGLKPRRQPLWKRVFAG